MARYTKEERLRMLLLFREFQGNSRRAAGQYAVRYPTERRPSYKTIMRVAQRYREIGHVELRKSTGRPVSACTAANEEAILAYVYAHPRAGTRRIASEAGISQRSVLRVLKRNKFHPFHSEYHQGLRMDDPPKRLTFCNWALASFDDDPTLASRIIWSDETTFYRDGTVNRHNEHYWSQENPHLVRVGQYQNRFKVNVWCGILGTSIVGPYFLDDILTGESYHEFLRESLSAFLDELPLATARDLWYQQDGAPAHFSTIARTWLNTEFRGRWIGRAGPVLWPPRSPDLTPLDFFYGDI